MNTCWTSLQIWTHEMSRLTSRISDAPRENREIERAGALNSTALWQIDAGKLINAHALKCLGPGENQNPPGSALRASTELSLSTEDFSCHFVSARWPLTGITFRKRTAWLRCTHAAIHGRLGFFATSIITEQQRGSSAATGQKTELDP